MEAVRLLSSPSLYVVAEAGDIPCWLVSYGASALQSLSSTRLSRETQARTDWVRGHDSGRRSRQEQGQEAETRHTFLLTALDRLGPFHLACLREVLHITRVEAAKFATYEDCQNGGVVSLQLFVCRGL